MPQIPRCWHGDAFKLVEFCGRLVNILTSSSSSERLLKAIGKWIKLARGIFSAQLCIVYHIIIRLTIFCGIALPWCPPPCRKSWLTSQNNNKPQ
ncbi:hypothetical protein MLPF_1232 [Mycobacterium lepromatosis]|nr:hypothetical protein MLPF_1232 [Mycobacterium lepromatosis]